jgi:hypothetical protein
LVLRVVRRLAYTIPYHAGHNPVAMEWLNCSMLK